MAGIDPKFLEKARLARRAVAAQLLQHPDVSLIDIGSDPRSNADPPGLAVRVYVRRPLDLSALGIPSDIDGIPVVVLAGNYRLE